MTINAVLDTTHDRWHWLGLPPSYEASMRFPGSREQISQACLEAVRQSGFDASYQLFQTAGPR